MHTLLLLCIIVASLCAALAQYESDVDSNANNNISPDAYTSLGFDEVTFWNDFIAIKDSEEVRLNKPPKLEDLVRIAAEQIADGYAKVSPIQPTAEVVEKLNKYYNPDAANYVDVDTLGNSDAVRSFQQDFAKERYELLSGLFDFSKLQQQQQQQQQQQDVSDRRSLISIPDGGLFNRTLGPSCATSYCELLQTALSCKALKIRMSKICAKYFVGLLFSCPGFPDKYELQNAPVSCQVEFANSAANLQQAAVDPSKSFIYQYAFSDFHENCKERCYQRYQQQSMDFFYGSECRNQVQSVLGATPITAPTTSPTAKPTLNPTAIPSASPSAAPAVKQKYPFMLLMWNFRMFRNQACTSATGVATQTPTFSPSAKPTLPADLTPTFSPTESPSAVPTPVPGDPTATPTAIPTTASPTFKYTPLPTPSPTAVPTAVPTTASPTISSAPIVSAAPTASPTTATPSADPSAAPTFLPTPLPGDPTFSPTPAPTAAPTLSPTHAAEYFETDCWMKVSATLKSLSGGAGLPYDCFSTQFGGGAPFVLNQIYLTIFKDIGCCYGTVIQIIQQAQQKPTLPPFLIPPCFLRYMLLQGTLPNNFANPQISGIPLSPTTNCPLGANANLSITTFTLTIARQFNAASGVPSTTGNILQYANPMTATGNLVLMTAINAALSNTNKNFQSYPYYFPNYLKGYSTNIGIVDFQYYDVNGNSLIKTSYLPDNSSLALLFQLCGLDCVLAEATTLNITVTIGFQGVITPSELAAITTAIKSPVFTFALAGSQTNSVLCPLGNCIGSLVQVAMSLNNVTTAAKQAQFVQSVGFPTVKTPPGGKGITQFTSAADPTTPNSSGFSFKFSRNFGLLQASLSFAMAIFVFFLFI